MNTLGIFIVLALIYGYFIWKADKIYPLMYLFLLIYFLQYVFSVYLIYHEYPVLKREMTVSEDQLFSYLIPALLSLFAGVFFFNKDVSIQGALSRIRREDAARLGHLLLAVSFGMELLYMAGFSQLRSILSFTYYLRFAGAMCYVFAPSWLNILLIILVYGTLARTALLAGVFIDFLAWAMYLTLILTLKYRFRFSFRFIALLISVPILILIQLVKNDYRQLTWSGKRDTGIGLFTEIAEKKQEADDPFARSEGVISAVGRLNQGWHLGMVLKRVPKNEPFSNGEDFFGDLKGIVLPRIFFPEKKIIGSQDKFEKFTGHDLIGSTSMTIGVLGDFYINFGWWGSLIGLFIFGAVMARIFYWFMITYVIENPVRIVWVPFIFSYLVRANNDFYIVVNNLFKGLLLFFFVEFLYRQIWPPRKIIMAK